MLCTVVNGGNYLETLNNTDKGGEWVDVFFSGTGSPGLSCH